MVKDMYTENLDLNERNWREKNEKIFYVHGLE